MDKPKLPKREEFGDLNDYLKAVSRYNQAISEPIIHAIPNFKIDDKDIQGWLRFNKEFAGKIIIVKHFVIYEMSENYLRYRDKNSFGKDRDMCNTIHTLRFPQ